MRNPALCSRGDGFLKPLLVLLTVCEARGLKSGHQQAGHRAHLKAQLFATHLLNLIIHVGIIHYCFLKNIYQTKPVMRLKKQ